MNTLQPGFILISLAIITGCFFAFDNSISAALAALILVSITFWYTKSSEDDDIVLTDEFEPIDTNQVIFPLTSGEDFPNDPVNGQVHFLCDAEENISIFEYVEDRNDWELMRSIKKDESEATV